MMNWRCIVFGLISLVLPYFLVGVTNPFLGIIVSVAFAIPVFEASRKEGCLSYVELAFIVSILTSLGRILAIFISKLIGLG